MEENTTQASLADRFLGGLIDWLVVIAISYLLRGILGWQLTYLDFNCLHIGKGCTCHFWMDRVLAKKS